VVKATSLTPPQEGGNGGDEPALQPARRPDADQLAHERAEIEAAGMNQQAFSNVGVAAEVHATHPAGLIEMGEGAFQVLAVQAQQPQSAWAADAPTIAVHGVAGGRILFPVPPSTIRFGDVTADAHRLEIEQRLVAVREARALFPVAAGSPGRPSSA
jgi:hypothetical protein